MFKSIWEDIKYNFLTGHMITRLIIINVAIYMVMALLGAFLQQGGLFLFMKNNLAVPGQLSVLMYKPWTLFTHMFLHLGFWHLLWNMVALHMFGRIVGDLAGDYRILPTYILGGLVGAGFYIMSFYLMGSIGSVALGASAGVMAIAVVAAGIAPDYEIRLLLFGNVKVKYIVAVFLFFDIIGAAGMDNSGGHIAHLGGALLGFALIWGLNRGTDVTLAMYEGYEGLVQRFSRKKPKKSPLRVEHNALPQRPKQRGTELGVHSPSKTKDEDRLDQILDKIKAKGYDQLSQEEKDFLKQVSNKF